jgi:outer membrane receptor protein involved in Fe transport
MYDIATQTTLWQNMLQGEYLLNKKGLKLSWDANYARLDRQRPDNHQLITNAIWDSLMPNNVNISTAGASGIAKGALRWWTRALENNYNWDAAVQVPFQLLQQKQLFKGGYAGWSKDRLFYVLRSGSTFNGNGYNIPLSSAFTPAYNSTFYFDSSFLDNSHKNASLHAFYGMLDNRLAAKLRLVWGVRAEFYDIGKVNGYIDGMEQASGSDYSALRSREKNWQFFPSANLTYNLTRQMNLRLSYAKSIIRPDLRELSYFREYDFELGGEYQGGLVRSTIIHNYDFRYEWYPSAGEIISFSVFYKKLNYPMEILKEGANRLYSLVNSKDAENYGVEIEGRKSFAFTHIPVLRNITLFGNFTYLDARVRQMTLHYPTDPQNSKKYLTPVEEVYDWEKRPQVGASNYMFNAGLYFDTNPVAISLAYNTITNRLFRAASHGHQNEALYEAPMKTLDAQLAVRLLKRKIEVKANVANLLNSFYVVYTNLSGWDENNNLSKKAAKYDQDTDLVDYKAAPGRTYSITISYTIK